MRNKLLATVAMTALIGCTSFAVAQNAGTQGGAMQSQGAQQHQMGGPGSSPGGGAMSGQSGGNAQNESTPSKSEPKGEQGKSVSQEERNKSSTPQRGAQGNGQEQRGAPGSAQEQRGAQNQPGTAGRASGGGANVQLTQDQRGKIKDVVVGGRNVARADNVNFNIRVGVAVPRTIHVAVLPAEVVTIVPEYRGFEYVVVGDQLLIIDPNTLEIVAILPA